MVQRYRYICMDVDRCAVRCVMRGWERIYLSSFFVESRSWGYEFECACTVIFGIFDMASFFAGFLGL